MTLGGNLWDILTSIGTAAAVIVSLGLARKESRRASRAEAALAGERLRQHQLERFSVANLITAWTESIYQPAPDGTHYTLTVKAHLSNESNEPVYGVVATIANASTRVQLGPLSLPLVVPVLAARYRRSWDITSGVLAHSVGVGNVPSEPVVKLQFLDSQGSEWSRSYDGVLREQQTDGVVPELDLEVGEQQLGPMENGFNPQFAASAFRKLLHDAKGVSDLEPILASTAEGWHEISQDEFVDFRSELDNFGMATHVWYPAPRVAYIRLIHDNDVDAVRSGGPGRVQMLTLILLPGEGWKIFSVGPAVTEPDWVRFPKKVFSKTREDNSQSVQSSRLQSAASQLPMR